MEGIRKVLREELEYNLVPVREDLSALKQFRDGYNGTPGVRTRLKELETFQSRVEKREWLVKGAIVTALAGALVGSWDWLKHVVGK